MLGVKRLRRDGELAGDVIYDVERGWAGPVLHDIEHPLLPAHTPPHDHAEDLLVRVMDRGTVVAPLPDLEAARARAARELRQLSPRTRRFLNPQPYPVGLDDHVHTRKLQMIAEASHA